MSESFAEKLAYWRRHGMQVATNGIRGQYEERVSTKDNGATLRELRNLDTDMSVYHHSDNDDRQDVTVRPRPVDVGPAALTPLTAP